MLSYELAKQLKEAGYPQIFGETHRFIMPSGDIKFVVTEHDDDVLNLAMVPPLSELISACGEKFKSLVYSDPAEWFATSYDGIIGEIGTTPEEAVAKLWLKLSEIK